MSKTALSFFIIFTLATIIVLSVAYTLRTQRVNVTPTKRVTYTALFAALAVVLNVFTIQTGIKYFVISFVAVPCFVGGVLLGPYCGFVIGFLGDLLGAVINPFGAYMPLIGIASGLWGFIPGAIIRLGSNNSIKYIFKQGGSSLITVKGVTQGYISYIAKTIISFALCLVICTAFLNTYALYLLYGNGRTFWVYLMVRFPMQSVVSVINCGICIILISAIKKNKYLNGLFLL